MPSAGIMRITEVTENEDFNRSCSLGNLRLPHLSSPTNLTGPRPQSSAAENTNKISRDRSIPRGKTENQPRRRSKSFLAKPQKRSRLENWKTRVPKFLPKTAERLCIVQRTYGVTVVPERVLFQNLRPQVERSDKKVLNHLVKGNLKKKESEQTNTEVDIFSTVEDLRTIEVDVPFGRQERNSEDASLNNKSFLANESSISLPDSPDEDKNSMPASFPTQPKKQFTKPLKKETNREEVVKKQEENQQWNKKWRSKSVRQKKTHPVKKDITDFFFKLTKKPALKFVIDPRFKDQERLLVDYYKRCQDFLLSEPKVDTVSKYCSNVNNSAERQKAKNYEESGINSKKEPLISDACINASEKGENDVSLERTLDDAEDILQKQSLNSLEDFDAFVARTVMERVSKNKKRRARIKSMLKKEYARKYNDVLNPSSDDESTSNHSNAASDEDCIPKDTVADEAASILSSCSSDGFSTLNDHPQPIINSIDKFDNFVAKTIKKHIHRQVSHGMRKRKYATTKSINSYDAWLHRRIFGYQSSRKTRENSNVNNLSIKKSNRRITKKKTKTGRYTMTSTDSLFSDKGQERGVENGFSKKVLIDDVLKAMKNIDHELTMGKLKKDHKDEHEVTTSDTDYSSLPSSLKLQLHRSDSLPMLSELQEKRAEALQSRIEGILTAPSIHRSYQIASAIPFKLPRKVFHFSDVDKCSKFEKMVQKYTGRDHVLLNSIKAMNDINLRILNFHKKATDKHKELLRKLEIKRNEVLIREGLMDRDYDDLEMKRQRQFLRKYYSPKRVLRNFTVNPMRNRYNMASKNFKVQDVLNVSKSFAELQNKKRKPVEKNKVVSVSAYIPILESESSDKKEIVNVTGEKMSECYDTAKSEIQSLYSSTAVNGYRSKKNLNLPQSVGTLSSDSSSDNQLSSSKGSKGIFEKFTRVETKKRERRERRERERARKKLMEAKKASQEEKNALSEMTTVTSVTDDEIVHVHVSAGTPPPPHPTMNETEKIERDESESLPTLTISKKLSDHSDEASCPKETVVGLTKMIDAMIENMDEEHDFDMMSGRKKRSSRKSSQGYSSAKNREAVNILKPLFEKKRVSKTSTKTFPTKINRIRSMRHGMQISSSQPATLPQSSLAPVFESSVANSPKNSKRLSRSLERQLSFTAHKKDQRGALVSDSTSRFVSKSSILHKSSMGTPQAKSKEDPNTQHTSKGQRALEKEFTDSKIFLEKAPKKSKKRDMRY